VVFERGEVSPVAGSLLLRSTSATAAGSGTGTRASARSSWRSRNYGRAATSPTGCCSPGGARSSIRVGDRRCLPGRRLDPAGRDARAAARGRADEQRARSCGWPSHWTRSSRTSAAARSTRRPPYPYLVLDALEVKCREGGRTFNVCVVHGRRQRRRLPRVARARRRHQRGRRRLPTRPRRPASRGGRGRPPTLSRDGLRQVGCRLEAVRSSSSASPWGGGPVYLSASRHTPTMTSSGSVREYAACSAHVIQSVRNAPRLRQRAGLTPDGECPIL
jgi:hypothetical protein